MPVKPTVAVLAAVLCGVLTSPASALGPIDQQQPFADGAITMPPGIAQTFTVGRSGGLDGVTLSSPTSARINYQFYDLRPDGTPDVTRPRLAQNGTASILAGVPATIGFPAFRVAAGDRLALAVGTIRSYASDQLATAAGDRYPAGELFQVSGYWTFTSLTGVDLQFSTHVTAAPAPTVLTVAPLSSTSGRPTAVLETATAQAVAGRTVTFQLLRAGGDAKSTCSATTDATGTATCAKALVAARRGQPARVLLRRRGIRRRDRHHHDSLRSRPCPAPPSDPSWPWPARSARWCSPHPPRP